MAVSSSQVVPMVGLCNSGTVCYVNSVLQLLYHMDDVRSLLVRTHLDRAYLAEGEGGNDDDDDNDTAAPAAAAALEVCRAIGELFHGMLLVGHAADNVAATPVDAAGCPSVDPLECYKRIYPVIVRAQGQECESSGDAYDLLYDKEGDVSAVLREILGCLCCAIDGAASSSDCPWPSLRGSLLHKVRVHGDESSKSEPFFLLSLNVSSGSLSAALDSYFAPQEVALLGEGIAAVSCALESAPLHLFLHLKRIAYSAHRRRKVFSYFEYDEEISLDKYAIGGGGALDYALVGVVVHEGGAESGHYYSFVRSRAAGALWREMDDEWGAPFDFANLIDETFGDDEDEEGGAAGEPLAMVLVYERQVAS